MAMDLGKSRQNQLQPLKTRPAMTSSPIRKFSTPPEAWLRSDKEKADLFAEDLTEVFITHYNNQVHEKKTIVNYIS